MDSRRRKPYPTDRTDEQWALVEPIILAYEDRIRPGPERTVDVPAANVDDGVGAQKVMGKLQPGAFPRLQAIFGDSKYRNHEYNKLLAEHSGGKWYMVISSPPPDATTFKPLPIRRVVERTFA